MSVKLYYFDARGLCEPLRMILSIGGVEFEDIRIPVSMPPKIPDDIKKVCTWGQVPMVEFEGKKLCQSLAMGRYFAKKFKLVGATDFESALCDEYVDTCKEFLQAWVPAYMEQDPEKKAEHVKEITAKVEEKYLEKLNSLVEANGGKHLVGKGVTWADIWLSHVLNNVNLVVGADLLKKYPALRSMSENVFAVPQIKTWVEKRPKTIF